MTPWWRCHRGVPAEPEFTRFVLFLQLFTPGKGRGKCGRGWREIGPIPQRCLLFLPLPPRPRREAKMKNLPGNMEFPPGFGVPGTGRTPDRTGDLFPLFPSVFSSRCSQPTPEFPVISPARRPSRIPPGHGMSRVPQLPLDSAPPAPGNESGTRAVPRATAGTPWGKGRALSRENAGPGKILVPGRFSFPGRCSFSGESWSQENAGPPEDADPQEDVGP